MSCASMARQLVRLSENLLKYDDRLTEDSFGKPMTTFQKQLNVFQEKLEAVVKGEEDKPDIRALQERLGSPAARLLNDGPTFAAFAKGILGKKFTIKKTESLAEARARFIESIYKNRQAKKAVKIFDLMVREQNAPEIDPEDETTILRELDHLGQLDDDALELAFATRYKKEKLVRKMAAAAHLKITSKTAFPSVVKKLILYARNAVANTSF